MSVSTTLLWIVILLLVIAVAVLAWRLWQTTRARRADVAPRDCEDAAPPDAGEAQSAPRRRSAPPPPAAAGGYTRSTVDSGEAASAGSRAGNGSRQDTFQTTRRRTAKPPPALAGHIPGLSASPAAAPTHARRRSGVRPPAAAAGHGGRDDDSSDPEPARRRSVPVSRFPKHPQTSSPADALSRASSWGYQLQDLELARAGQAPFDLLVIDYSHDGSEEDAFTPQELARLKRGHKPDRLVYAYISVGEAESYRYYWQRGWKRSPPAWLVGENADWQENYTVRFWDRDWQRILFGTPDSYIGRIAAAGFDGIYLDRCDVHEEITAHHPNVSAERADIEADMVGFVTALSDWVRSAYPGFGIIMQNAEGLLTRAQVRAAIDAVAKEELLFGLDAPETRNRREDVMEARAALDLMRREGKAVFAVEYLDRPELRLEAAGALRAMGYVPYMARKDRELATLELEQPAPAVA